MTRMCAGEPRPASSIPSSPAQIIAGALAFALLVCVRSDAAAQSIAGASGVSRGAIAGLTTRVGARAIVVATHATGTPGGRRRAELYLTQPMLMLHASRGGWLTLDAAASLEGLTLDRGELNAGIYGEGYVDRRHPHTYSHEIMASVSTGAGRGGASIALGKGFAPFGSDDPMTRPLVKYPANHHLAQVLERAIAVAAVRVGRASLEGAFFNGDEPERPGDAPNAERFGDSWSARLTIVPVAGVEVAGSHAWIKSPEIAVGGGLDHRKTSLVGRVDRTGTTGDRQYALVEWARSDELDRGERAFRFSSVLAEASLARGVVEVSARLERTTRPEEDRLLDPFRSPQPPADLSILGITRWDIATLAIAVSQATRRRGASLAQPFVEIRRLRARQVARPSAFVPRDFYGTERMWCLSAGVRLRAGLQHARAGRYGAARMSSHETGAPHERHAR